MNPHKDNESHDDNMRFPKCNKERFRTPRSKEVQMNMDQPLDHRIRSHTHYIAHECSGAAHFRQEDVREVHSREKA
jgi:hypothetical protein